MNTIHVRKAEKGDAEDIASIYNQGIREGTATFETSERTGEDILGWLDGPHPVVVAELSGSVIAFASSFKYSDRECYSGVSEFSVYVHKDRRRNGAGSLVMTKLIEECGKAGIWKLVSRVFPENTASRKLLGGIGFREVGTYMRHGKLNGVWKDVIIVEYLILK